MRVDNMKNTYELAKDIYNIFTKGKPHTFDPVDRVFISVEDDGFFTMSFQPIRKHEYVSYFPNEVNKENNKNDEINRIVAKLTKIANQLNYERERKAPAWNPMTDY